MSTTAGDSRDGEQDDRHRHLPRHAHARPPFPDRSTTPTEPLEPPRSSGTPEVKVPQPFRQPFADPVTSAETGPQPGIGVPGQGHGSSLTQPRTVSRRHSRGRSRWRADASMVGSGARWRSRSTPTEKPSLSSMARRMVTTSAGIAQKSPQTHKMAAPICWSAKGESVTPGTCGVDGVPAAVGEERQRHGQDEHDHVGGDDRPDLPQRGGLHPERVGRDDLQPEQDPGREEAGVHQPDMDRLVLLGGIEERRDVPEHHDGVEGDQRGPGIGHEASGGPQRGREAPEQQSLDEAPPEPDRKAVEERQPGRTGHDEDRRVERDQEVLDHVHEEVVVRPVVDGGHDREQEQCDAAVEEQRSQSPFPGVGGHGAPAQIGQAHLVQGDDHGGRQEEGVEAPIVDQVAHAVPPSAAAMPVTVARSGLSRDDPYASGTCAVWTLTQRVPEDVRAKTVSTVPLTAKASAVDAPKSGRGGGGPGQRHDVGGRRRQRGPRLPRRDRLDCPRVRGPGQHGQRPVRSQGRGEHGSPRARVPTVCEADHPEPARHSATSQRRPCRSDLRPGRWTSYRAVSSRSTAVLAPTSAPPRTGPSARQSPPEREKMPTTPPRAHPVATMGDPEGE